MKDWLILAFVFVLFTLQAQKDSIPYSENTPWPDGVYLSYNALKKHKPISEDRIVSDQNKEDPYFITKVLSEKTFSFIKKDEVIKLPSAEIWAYMQNNTMFMNVNGEFYRVPAFGAISYFGSYQTPSKDRPQSMSENRASQKEYVFDYYTGEVAYFSVQKVEDLLKRDSVIYHAFSELNPFKKKEQVYLFIRKFNSAHPLYHLK